MKKKTYLLILILMLFIPTITSPIIPEQNEIKSKDTKTLTKASPSSIPFIYGTIGKPYTIDPINCWDSASATIIDQVAETLFTYNYSDPNLPLIPLLATNATDISYIGLNYTIDLRENVIFHDGTKFNATAVKWNFDRMEYWYNLTGLLPSSEVPGYPRPLFYFEDGETPIWNHTEILGDYKIKFVLNAPFVAFLDLLTYTATAMVSPTSHGWDYTAPYSTGFQKGPVGTGPFVFDYFNYSGDEAKFHAFENYWREPANISEIIFSYYDWGDEIALATDLMAGSIHMIDQIALSMLNDLKSHPNLTVLDEGKTDSTILYLTFNNNLLNQTWRQALSYAINYSFFIKELEAGTVARLKSPVPEGILYSNYGFNYPDLNITRAREIMQSMGFGFTGGIPWDATYPGTDETLWTSASFATYSFWVLAGSSLINLLYSLCRDWFELIGITLIDEITGWQTFITNFEMDPDWVDMWLSGWGCEYNDPSRAINPLLSNVTSAINGQVNDTYLQNLMDQGLTETDPPAREATYNEIQRYTVEELIPYAWLYNDKLYHAHHVNLTGFTQNVFNRYFFYYCKWAPPFTFDIEILSSGDISFIKGSTGNIINWTIFSDALLNPTINFYVNNTLEATGTWEDNKSFIFNLDDLPVGTHEYKIEVFNWNKTAEDVVIVTVEPFVFDITHPSDINYDEGDTGNVVLWTVTSNLISNPNYTIYIDDVLNRTGFWESGEPIAITVDGLPVGTYEYRIEVHNLNNTIQDIVIVTVKAPKKSEPSIPGYSVLFLVGISVLTILYMRIKLMKKLS